MNLIEYQRKARNTAIYLNIQDTKIIYPAIGLIGECGEVAEKIKKLIRDANYRMTPDRALAIANELGDCCWYLANICCDINLDLNMMYQMRGASMIQHVRTLTLPQLILRMNKYATDISCALGKWYYKFDGYLNEANRFPEIPLCLSGIISCIEEIGHRCNFTLKEICTMNIEKLTNRQKNQTLHGEGDNR